MCTSGGHAQGNNGAGESEAKRVAGGGGGGGGELLSEDVKVINNLIEDLSRLDPLETPLGRSVRAYNRYDANYTMETEFHSSGSLTGGGGGPGGPGGSSGNGMSSKRRLSVVSNSSRSSRQPFTTAATVPSIIEKQPGITEQVK
jgi:hypothetical protein